MLSPPRVIWVISSIFELTPGSTSCPVHLLSAAICHLLTQLYHITRFVSIHHQNFFVHVTRYTSGSLRTRTMCPQAEFTSGRTLFRSMCSQAKSHLRRNLTSGGFAPRVASILVSLRTSCLSSHPTNLTSGRRRSMCDVGLMRLVKTPSKPPQAEPDLPGLGA